MVSKILRQLMMFVGQVTIRSGAKTIEVGTKTIKVGLSFLLPLNQFFYVPSSEGCSIVTECVEILHELPRL